jgi:hypothetical protein
MPRYPHLKSERAQSPALDCTTHERALPAHESAA